MSETILIVDDEPRILQTLRGVLADEGFQVNTADNGAEALRFIQKDSPALVLLDIWMPDLDGIEVLKRIKEGFPEVIVVIMSGHGSIETAVKATKLGAYDYIEKPISLEKIILTVRHALHEKKLEMENLRLREKLKNQLEIIGESPGMRRLKEQIKTAGPTNSRVLISGENGTGKELVARAIHSHSLRAEKPFIEINCAAIPDTLIESELFGYEKGAFTGAVTAKKGRFELADGGTLFLDEIGDMSLTTQAKVLRVLQEQHFDRIGGTKTTEVDVRVIAASNKNLGDEIKKGAFREDLYYRLNVIPLHVPPLRERKEDIPLLIHHFLASISLEQGVKAKGITKEAIEVLMQYDWPGNVRELKNTIERILILFPHSTIDVQDLTSFLEWAPSIQQSPLTLRSFSSLKDARALFEKHYITQRLKEHQWNVSKTAESLGIERSHLHRKIKLLGIETEDTEKK
jgi:two-component system nitrogen regulation response regulator NtrX